MGNAHANERRKSGVPETGLVIEEIRSSPALNVTAEAAEVEENQAPSKCEDTGFRPRAATTSGATTAGKKRSNNNRKMGSPPIPDVSGESGPISDMSGLGGRDDEMEALAGSDEKVGPRGLPTIFKYGGQAKEVYVCGTFNDWKKIPMVKSQKDFVALIDLPLGNHEYKFLVDNNWTHDPNLPSTSNKMGTKNNLIKIQQGDFDADTALDLDSKSTRQKRGTSSSADIEFGQNIPGLSSFENKTGPPILPPHLLQVILNKDTPLSCEPTLLPEPNHVMINHLYALSIKDGVMVISSTQRYRKKYVTTLLYKPIDGAA